MFTQKMTGTFLRTKETMDSYKKFMDLSQKEKDEFGNCFKKKTNRIKEFKYWAIIENDFPYDNLAQINHMIFPKREVSFSWDLLNNEEKDELSDIRKNYLNDSYDMVYENLPSGQTLPGWFHLHLIKLKRWEFEM